MSDIFSIAASGLSAAQLQLAVTGSNIANAQTPGYQARRADLVELSGGGVGIAGIQIDPTPAPPNPDGTAGSNVDLATESAALVREQAFYNANAAVVRTASQMLGTLLDVLDHHHDDHGGGSR